MKLEETWEWEDLPTSWNKTRQRRVCRFLSANLTMKHWRILAQLTLLQPMMSIRFLVRRGKQQLQQHKQEQTQLTVQSVTEQHFLHVTFFLLLRTWTTWSSIWNNVPDWHLSFVERRVQPLPLQLETIDQLTDNKTHAPLHHVPPSRTLCTETVNHGAERNSHAFPKKCKDWLLIGNKAES